MTQRSDRPLVGQQTTLAALTSALDKSATGPHCALLSGPKGSGRGRAIGSFLQELREQKRHYTLVPLHHLPGDDAIRTLLRVYGSSVTAIARSAAFDNDPFQSLTEAADKAEDDETRDLFLSVAESARELRDTPDGTGLKIKLPATNPYRSLLLTFDVLGPRCPWILDLRGLGGITSPSFWVFLSALLGRSRARNWKMLFLVTPGEAIYGEKPGEALPGPAAFMHSLFGDGMLIEPPALSNEQISELLDTTYQPNDFPAGFSTQISTLCAGHPESLHEFLDALEEDETITWDDEGYSLSDLEDVDLDVLVPMVREEDDGEEEQSEEALELQELMNSRLLEKVLHVAAVEGRQFTSSLIRTYLGAAEDEVDDALDAMPHIIEEGAYNETLGTWSYRFRYDFYRRWYLDNPPEGTDLPEVETIAAALGRIVLQSYAPATIEYVPRGARLFRAAGEARGARNLLAMAMGADRAELVEFAVELCAQYPDSPFPEGLERFLYCGSADRAVNTLAIEKAIEAVDRAASWAKHAGDESSLAYVELLRCRLLVRQGQADEARAQGEKAAQQLLAAGDDVRAGETFNQLAMIALGTGQPKASETYLRQAKKASTIPPVMAHSQYIDGILNKRKGQQAKAAECFARSVELSTEAGNLLLGLEAMLGQAECSLITGRGAEVAPILERALEISRAVRNVPRERLAARLLCQAEAARGQLEAAFEMSCHALELTREIGDGGEEGDLYHCGVFGTMAGKEQEGLDYLEAARAACEDDTKSGLLPEILFNIAQIKLKGEEYGAAQSALEQGLGLVQGGSDRGREIRFLESLGNLLSSRGEHSGAAARYKQAADRALGPQAKELRRNLRKRIEQEQKLAVGAGA
jgi:tetratricopeptide (TPR) repeat protein